MKHAAWLCLSLSITALAGLATSLMPSYAHAGFEWDYSGMIRADTRFRVRTDTVGDWYNVDNKAEKGVSRNEILFKQRLDVDMGAVAGVVDVDFVWRGRPNANLEFADLTNRNQIDPFRLEAHAVYVDVADFVFEGLDLRLGQQIVNWGVGDQFNPTNVFNARDFEDPLMFGELQANVMARADYQLFEDVVMSAVFIPIFKPSLLPQSAKLGLIQLDRVPFVEDEARWRINNFREAGLHAGYPTVLTKATINRPALSLGNMQGGARIAGTIGNHDVALSYFRGRSDIPQPLSNYSEQVTDAEANRRCHPDYLAEREATRADGFDPGALLTGPNQCLMGRFETQATLHYPKMHMVGINVAGQFNLLGWLIGDDKPVGYRFEAGIFFPERSEVTIETGPVDLLSQQLEGELDYGLGGSRPLAVDNRAFVKWVLGLDYTVNRYLYLNVQWIHGFPEEFGAGDFLHESFTTQRAFVSPGTDVAACAAGTVPNEQCAGEFLRPRLGDYLVLGNDLKLLDDRLLARLFFILDVTGIYEEHWDIAAGKRVRKHHSFVTSQGFSAIIFPEFTYNAGGGLELSLGGFIPLGKDHTKFGNPQVGSPEVWTRARFSY